MGDLIQTILVVFAVDIVIVAAVVGFVYFKNLKTIKGSQQHYMKVHEELKTGKQVQFAGGLIGKVVSVKEDTCDVEIAKDVVITISRYSINSISDK